MEATKMKKVGLALVIVAWWSIAANATDTCPKTSNVHDDVVWAVHNCDRDFKSFFRSYFGLEKGDWDGGWGWKKCDPKYAFPKMINAGLLLTYGIEPWETYPPGSDAMSKRSWAAENSATVATPTGFPLRIDLDPAKHEPSAYYYPGYSYHYVGINASGDLIHYRGGQNPTDWVVMNITSRYVTYNVSEYRLKEHPVLITDETYLYYYGRNSANDLIRYQRHILGGPWWADNVTKNLAPPTEFRPTRRLTAIYNGAVVRAYGINRNGELIEYGPNDAVNLTKQPPTDNESYKIARRLVGATDHLSQNHVYGLNNENDLIHYQGVPTGNWSAENVLTERLGGNTEFRFSRSYKPVLLRFSDGVHELYGVHTAGDLFVVRREANGNWTSSNLTVQIATSSQYTLEPRTSISAVIAPDGSRHVYGINSTGDLIHYFASDSSWVAENLTTRGNIGAYYRVAGIPVAIIGANGSHHVYARGRWGGLYHYYWTSSLSWNADRITSRRSIGENYAIYSDPIVAISTDGSHHVFGLNLDDNLIHYYTSAQIHPWHSNDDYRWIASGWVHDYHYEPRNESDSVASANGGPLEIDRVKMKCPSFDGTKEGAPAGRAAAMLHEAIHVIYHRWWGWQHQEHPADLCDGNVDGESEECADDWLGHGLDDYGPGELNKDRTHSMYQIQVEFLCDLSEFPADWVTAYMITYARSMADTYLAIRIINPPNWTCGDPRPF
jgi:hypothetical protein